MAGIVRKIRNIGAGCTKDILWSCRNKKIAAAFNPSHKFYIAPILAIIFITAVALASMPFATANAQNLFTGWKYSAETVTVNNMVYTFNWRDDTSVIGLRYGTNYQNIDMGSCEILRGTNNTIEFCYEKNEFDMNRREFRAYLKISSREPKMKIDRKFSDTNMVIGMPSTVNVKLTNDGAMTAFNMQYRDFLQGFEVSKCNGCKVSGDAVVWDLMFLDPGKSEEITYEIIPKVEMQKRTTAKLKYSTDAGEEEITSQAVDIRAMPIVSVRMMAVDPDYYANNMGDVLSSGRTYIRKGGFGPQREIKGTELKDIRIGETIKLIIELTNNAYGKDSRNRVQIDNIDIKLQPNLALAKASTVRARYNSTSDTSIGEHNVEKITDHHFTWKGSLDDERRYIVLSMEARLTGYPQVQAAADLTYRGSQYDIETQKHDIKIINITPSLTIGFEKRDPGTKNYMRTEYLERAYSTESEKDEIIVLRLGNPSINTKLRNVRVVLDSAIFEDNPEYHIPVLDESTTIQLDKLMLKMPYVDRSRRIDLDVRMSWDSEYGEEFDISRKYTINVDQRRDLELTHRFSKGTVYGGDELEVTVRINNRRPTPIYGLTISDDYGDFILKRGMVQQKTDIRANSNIDAYKYVLTVPEVADAVSLCINTTAQFAEKGEDYEVSKGACVNVRPKRLDLDIQATTDRNEIFIGQNFHINYMIRNRDDETAYALNFNFPLTSNIDLVGDNIVSSREEFNRNEVWNVNGVYRVRAKAPGNLQLQPVKLNYLDAKGLDYTVEGGSRRVTVKDQNLHAPALMITRHLSYDDVLVDEIVGVEVRVENIGQGVAHGIEIWDNGELFSIEKIEEKQIRSVSYELSFAYPGEYIIEPAVMSYRDDIWNYLTVSDASQINVFEDIDINDYIPIDEDIATIPIEEEEKNIFIRIMEYVYNLLFWTKSE